METFAEPKDLVENPGYRERRQEMLATLTDDMIDRPLIELVNALNSRPYCYTLQCCYGHFLYDGQEDPYSLASLPITDTIANVEYKIAYVVFCIDNSLPGTNLLSTLKQVALIDPDYIQLCSATWFWERQVNSYALQVEPDRYKDKDNVKLAYHEALHIQTVRAMFFTGLKERFRTLPG